VVSLFIKAYRSCKHVKNWLLRSLHSKLIYPTWRWGFSSTSAIVELVSQFCSQGINNSENYRMNRSQNSITVSSVPRSNGVLGYRNQPLFERPVHLVTRSTTDCIQRRDVQECQSADGFTSWVNSVDADLYKMCIEEMFNGGIVFVRLSACITSETFVCLWRSAV
jgi:hypothetical protein